MQTYSKAYRAWLLAILLVSNALNLADRLGMAAVSQAIKVDLRFTDAQMGLIQGLVGVGIGPTLLGLLSDAFGAAAFAPGNFKLMCPGGAPPHGEFSALQRACAEASATGIRQAMMAMSVFLLWAAVHYFLAARTLRADLLKTHVALPTR